MSENAFLLITSTMSDSSMAKVLIVLYVMVDEWWNNGRF